MALFLEGTELCPPGFLTSKAIVHRHFFAGLDVVAQGLAISQAHAAAFVEGKLGIDQEVAMVLEQPLDAHAVAVEDLFVGFEHHDDVAIGLEAFLFVANQV